MSKSSQTSAILNHLLKENQQRKNPKSSTKNDEKARINTRYVDQKLNDVNVEYCSYCNKGFSNSRFLLRHILRRHAEDLLHMHGQLVRSNCKRSSEKEFKTKFLLNTESQSAELKKMLHDFKIEILQQLQFVMSNYCDNIAQLNVNQENVQNQKYNHETFEQLLSEFRELKLQCQHYETFIESLEKRYSALVESVKCETTRNEMKRQQKNSEMKIMVQNSLRSQENEMTMIKEDLEKQFNVLRQVLCKEIQKQYSHLDNKIENFKHRYSLDMQALKLFTEQNAAQIETIQEGFNIEEIFEKHLQKYMSKIPKKTKIQRRNRKYLPNSTFGTHCIDNFKNASTSKSSNFSSEFNSLHHNQKSVSSLPYIENKEISKLKESEYMDKKESSKRNMCKPLFITKRIKFALQNDPNVLKGIFEEISKRLNHKLQTYGIESNQTKLSISEFKSIKQLIDEEFNQSNSKNFISLKNKIDDLVTKKVKLYRRKKDKYREGVISVNPESIVQLSDEKSTLKKSIVESSDVDSLNQTLNNAEHEVLKSLEPFNKQLSKNMSQEFIFDADSHNQTFDAELPKKRNRSYISFRELPLLPGKFSYSSPIMVKPSSVYENETPKNEISDENSNKQFQEEEKRGSENANLPSPNAQVSNFVDESSGNDSDSKSSLESVSYSEDSDACY